MTSTTLRIIDGFVSRSVTLGYRLLARDTLGHSLFSDGAAVRTTRFALHDIRCDNTARKQANNQRAKEA